MKIAFCSCSNINQQNGVQPIWKEIHDKDPDILLLLGDNVYMGSDNGYDGDLLELHYQQQCEEPHFKALLDKVDYLAVWDNHDFGLKAEQYADELTFDQRSRSRQLFNTYLKAGSLRPNGDEIYCYYDKDDVRIIMLDVRSKQTDPEAAEPTLLGDCQEEWLLKKMKHDGRFTVICSGMPFSMGAKHSWLDYPDWTGRFCDAIRFAPNPLFLGGSMHKNGYRKHLKPVISTSGSARSSNDPLPPAFLEPNFYELISSSVGRNKGGHRKNSDPLDKYGIIKIKNDKVEFVLHSANENNRYHRIIDANTWKFI